MRDGARIYTPLFLVLVLIGVTDIVFAVNSIPAIFAVTSDPFIVFTANTFAILGLRAMYFLLADMADRFHLLGYGLAAIVTLVGVKMLVMDFWKFRFPGCSAAWRRSSPPPLPGACCARAGPKHEPAAGCDPRIPAPGGGRRHDAVRGSGPGDAVRQFGAGTAV